MTAGMTTVAFAAAPSYFPVVGVKHDGSDTWNHAFIINDDVANGGSDGNEVLEGGDELAIPVLIVKDADDNGKLNDGDSLAAFDRSYDYKTSNVKVYADWDDVAGDVKGDVKLRWVKYDTAATEFGANAGYYYSVVVTVPENNGDKALDLVGKISVGRTSTAARNAENSVKVEAEFAPDGTRLYYTADFDGGILDDGKTGIVAFDKNADEIDIEFGEEAMFTVDVTGQDKLNLAWNTKFDKEFANKYSYANLDFLTFEGKPVFNRNGDFYIYAEEDEFVYEVTADGAKALKAEWDEGYEAWTFKTCKLGSYVISDVELDEQTVTEDKNESSKPEGDKANPDTGR